MCWEIQIKWDKCVGQKSFIIKGRIKKDIKLLNHIACISYQMVKTCRTKNLKWLKVEKRHGEL